VGKTVVSYCDSAEVLDAPDHALDGVAIAVEGGREAVLPASMALGGIFGAVPLLSILRRTASLSYPLSPYRIVGSGIWSSRVSAAIQSATWPPVNRNAIGRQRLSVSAWIFVVRPPRERPIA
jgi:hypothetical protein